MTSQIRINAIALTPEVLVFGLPRLRPANRLHHSNDNGAAEATNEAGLMQRRHYRSFQGMRWKSCKHRRAKVHLATDVIGSRHPWIKLGCGFQRWQIP